MTTATAPTTTLQAALDAAEQRLIQAAPAEAIATINAGIADLVGAGIAAQSLQPGDPAPDFTLPAAAGGTLTLSDALRAGPVVLTFYRGEWCPYCDVQLRGYQQALASFAEQRATLIAISPQTLAHTQSTAEQKELAFPALSDAGNAVARQYGLVYRVDDKVRATLAGLGIDLAVYNGDETAELPLTATFVIDEAGVIRWAAVEADFRRRPDPAQIVAALEGLARG